MLESVDLSHNLITTLPVLAETRFGAALREDPDLSLNLYYNPLDAGSIANMSIVGAAFEPEIALPTEPDGDWLQGASQAQRELWQDFFDNDGHGALRDMLDRLALSSEFRVNADDVRKRVWSMLELASQHTQLREELAAIAGDFPVTCGDAGADAFSALEIAVLVFQRSEAARVGERGADLLALYKQLFRRHEVQRMADVLSLARTRRRLALLNDEVLTPLDPLDDISNADLESESVDDIEIRLAMRQALAAALDYPEPSRGMLFERTAHLSKQTIKRVADAVKVRDTVTNRQGWMVGEGSWQRYLKQQYAGQFETLSASWAQGLDYLDYCNAVSDEVPAKLDAKVLKTLRGSLKAEPLNADGTLRKLDIDSAEYVAAVEAVAGARYVAEAALIDTLTKA
ncbi:MAG: NEL-type E3 ubiquitin ligase domain-containing protein, partial [Pseudomonas sp.]